ncbi:hypothetical protein CHS0354_009865 [Potamilus streckersoni]|uniref:Uncharacterized protein n=1 Tax=Potamilus streckersoni TaxID=2493646 RepID=A0AAE0SXB7_9BIVA|nr:hypothetical protein CHS0354_009865 [Potamilus streckersoni]
MIFHGGCIILLLTAITFVFADQAMDSNGVYVKVLGHSGKIMVGKKQNSSDDPNSVFIEFDEIKEKDSSGNEVGKSGATKHSFNTFASQSFSFTSLVDVEYQNISAKMFNFSASLTTVNAILVTSVYIFTEDGNITVANESTYIKAGNVKFNTEIKGWKFCGSPGVSCKQGQNDEQGVYIDFVIVIKGKGSASKSKKRVSDGEEYDLGGGAGVILSKKVKYDDKDWTNMSNGYPKMTTTGGKQIFTFRFEKFNSSALYDPTVTVGGSDVGNGGCVLSASSMFAFTMMSMLYLLFSLM